MRKKTLYCNFASTRAGAKADKTNVESHARALASGSVQKPGGFQAIGKV